AMRIPGRWARTGLATDHEPRLGVAPDDFLSPDELDLTALQHQSEGDLCGRGIRRLRTSLPRDSDVPAVALPRDRPDPTLGPISERFAQLRDLEAQRVVGDRDIRPQAVRGRLAREEPGRILQEEQE